MSAQRAIAFSAACGLAIGCGGGTVSAQAGSGGSTEGGLGGASGGGLTGSGGVESGGSDASGGGLTGSGGVDSGGSDASGGGLTGSGGVESDGSDASGGCVDVSHVGPLQKTDLRVIGAGFDAYEGLTIRVFATLGEPAYGMGEAQIEGGAFDLLLPGVLGDYTGLAVHVDRVRDHACNPDREFIWQQGTGPMSAWGPRYSVSSSGGVIWEITPDKLRVFPPAGLCNINGIFDLTIPLSCPAGN